MAHNPIRFRKVWQHQVNQLYRQAITSDDTYRQLLLGIKNSLKNFVVSPWVVQGSSDGSTAGMDQVDRWVDNADLVWGTGGNPKSWIVLSNPGMPGLQMVWELGGSSTPASLWTTPLISATGFSGGSTTARPTAADEWAFGQSTFWCDSSLHTRVQTALHVSMSLDGKNLRVWFCTLQGRVTGYFALDSLIDAPQGMTPAVAASWTASNVNVVTVSNFLNGVNTKVRGSTGLSQGVYITTEGANTNFVVSHPETRFQNDYDGHWPVLPAGVMGRLAGVRGRLGSIPDLWHASDALPVGSLLGESRQVITLGSLAVPWDGSINPRIGG